jgi:hypothetical protein
MKQRGRQVRKHRTASDPPNRSNRLGTPMNATCSVTDCDKPAHCRGWCNAHYLRWQRHGDPLGGGATRHRGDAVCCIEGCDRPHYGHGWCQRHWARQRRTGQTGSAEIGSYRQSCQIDDCEQPHHARGYCNMHHLRWRSHGDPTVVVEPMIGFEDENPAWKGEGIGYGPAHTRIVRKSGSASIHACQNCGTQAEDWAYLHGAPDEQCDDRGRRYSTDPTYYVPLCRSCHKTFDNLMRQGA